MRFVTALMLVVVLALVGTACSSDSDYVYVAPAETEEIDADLWRVTLTESAAKRTGIETTGVESRAIEGEDRLTIPYSAVMYHYDGSTWTYTNPDPLTYVREAIDIDYIVGDLAVLDSGPAVGTTVVMVGAAELYGVEFGIGK